MSDRTLLIVIFVFVVVLPLVAFVGLGIFAGTTAASFSSRSTSGVLPGGAS